MGDPTGYLDEGKGLPWITMDMSCVTHWPSMNGRVTLHVEAASYLPVALCLLWRVLRLVAVCAVPVAPRSCDDTRTSLT